ncbi:Aldehyde/histidinol dehydrogenase, partial [Suillus subalutaceus]|uniref:Aldehyde/histidinol dehydrogenase n=1 Tax=Suillus subalutaceus TaxID=48586 RepID=UPI001B869049
MSAERKGLKAALAQMQQELPFDFPCIVNGLPIRTGKLAKQPIPARHLYIHHEADESAVVTAIDGALAAKAEWEAMYWNNLAAFFLHAAELVSGKYHYNSMAATMLGQGKNACRVEYRALEGFVLAISPFNFTTIGSNLPVLAIVGNTLIWKPSPTATYSNYLVYQIFAKAGVPARVIQFVVAQVIYHPNFAALHFTGRIFIFKKLWKDIATNLDKYRGYPRIVSETGGKNFHVIHKSADVRYAVLQSIRDDFEYQGQKCSALSRLYVSSSLWSSGFKDLLLSEVAKITVGHRQTTATLWDPGRPAYDKIMGVIQKAKDAGGEAYFIQPTIILTKYPQSITMKEEIFCPVITVYVYDDTNYEKTLELLDNTSPCALTGSTFAADRKALLTATNKLRNAAGNVYYNKKCTGAVVGQQPFGGARASGTNDEEHLLP